MSKIQFRKQFTTIFVSISTVFFVSSAINISFYSLGIQNFLLFLQKITKMTIEALLYGALFLTVLIIGGELLGRTKNAKRLK